MAITSPRVADNGAPSTEPALAWHDLSLADQLDYALRALRPTDFLTAEAVATFAQAWAEPLWQARIETRFREVGGFPLTLRRAIDDAVAKIPAGKALTPKHGTPTVRISAPDLMAKLLPPLVYVVESVLPAGNTLLVGKSKDGKSLMAYNLALAVASGGKALGHFPVSQGRVWYLALEDGERRAQARLRHQMAQYDVPPSALAHLEFTLWDSRRLGEGLEDDIAQWMIQPNARLVIIDILEKVRAPRKQNGSIYAEDYAATQSLTRLAQDHNCAILIIHHANKLNPADFRDSASGAMSLIGGADNIWSLNRLALSPEATLRVTGRDIIDEQDLALRFEDGYWSVIGTADEVQQSDTRKAIINLLRESNKPLTPLDVAKALQRNPSTIKIILRKMLDKKAIFQPSPGHYASLPSYIVSTTTTTNEEEDDEYSVNPVNPVNYVNPVNPVNRREDGFTAVYGGTSVYKPSQPIDNIDSYSGTVYGFTGFTVDEDNVGSNSVNPVNPVNRRIGESQENLQFSGEACGHLWTCHAGDSWVCDLCGQER